MQWPQYKSHGRQSCTSQSSSTASHSSSDLLCSISSPGPGMSHGDLLQHQLYTTVPSTRTASLMTADVGPCDWSELCMHHVVVLHPLYISNCIYTLHSLIVWTFMYFAVLFPPPNYSCWCLIILLLYVWYITINDLQPEIQILLGEQPIGTYIHAYFIDQTSTVVAILLAMDSTYIQSPTHWWSGRHCHRSLYYSWFTRSCIAIHVRQYLAWSLLWEKITLAAVSLYSLSDSCISTLMKYPWIKPGGESR